MHLCEHVEYCRYTDRVLGVVAIGCKQRCKETAQSLLVFMIRSIFGGWCQVVGHHYTRSSFPKEDLRNLIEQYLRSLHSASINCQAIICDQEPGHRSLFKSLGVTREYPFITSPVTGERVFILFDPPHLLKSARNNLINSEFVVSLFNYTRFRCLL